MRKLKFVVAGYDQMSLESSLTSAIYVLKGGIGT